MADIQYGPRRAGYYGAYGNTEDTRSRAVLTEESACSLAKQYDVNCLSRNEYSLLLRDLRNAGFITAQEFSAGYGGTLPHGAAKPPIEFPLGDNKADFVVLLKQCVQYCGEFLRLSARSGIERAHAKSLLSTYSWLYKLFKQLHDAVSRTDQEPKGGS